MSRFPTCTVTLHIPSPRHHVWFLWSCWPYLCWLCHIQKFFYITQVPVVRNRSHSDSPLLRQPDQLTFVGCYIHSPSPNKSLESLNLWVLERKDTSWPSGIGKCVRSKFESKNTSHPASDVQLIFDNHLWWWQVLHVIFTLVDNNTLLQHQFSRGEWLDSSRSQHLVGLWELRSSKIGHSHFPSCDWLWYDDPKKILMCFQRATINLDATN